MSTQINSNSSATPLTTPPPSQQQQHRTSCKDSSDNSLNARSKRKDALREYGRQQRHAILRQHRLSLSPVDLKGKLHADTMAAIRAQLHQPQEDNQGGEGDVLTASDIDALLRDIEQQVMEEIQAELADLERHEQEQAQHAASMAEQHYLQQQQQQQHTSQGSEDSGVLCPVCKSCQLLQRQGLLVCPGEGWRLNLAAESLNMADVRARLAAAYEEHAASGCRGQLCFSIDDLFGSDSLTCSCASCNCLAVVV